MAKETSSPKQSKSHAPTCRELLRTIFLRKIERQLDQRHMQTNSTENFIDSITHPLNNLYAQPIPGRLRLIALH